MLGTVTEQAVVDNIQDTPFAAQVHVTLLLEVAV